MSRPSKCRVQVRRHDCDGGRKRNFSSALQNDGHHPPGEPLCPYKIYLKKIKVNEISGMYGMTYTSLAPYADHLNFVGRLSRV